MMQQSIFKYPLTGRREQIVKMPALAKVIKVALQDGTLQAWALVRPDEPMVDHRFLILNTGEPTDYSTAWSEYRDTIFFPGGYVSHVFHIGETVTG